MDGEWTYNRPNDDYWNKECFNTKQKAEVRGIFCLNSRCKHYFEDNCMKIFETDTVHISKDGKCEDFKAGQHLSYADQPTLKEFSVSAGNKADWKKAISEAIDRVVERELAKHPDEDKDKRINIEIMLEGIKQSFTEQKYSPSKQKFIVENIALYEEMFEICMNGSNEEFKIKFLELSKKMGEA